MTAPVIIAKDVSARQYGKTVLDGISFELAEGQHLAILGESGSGKTSLAKAIAGKLFVSGNIEIHYRTETGYTGKPVFVEHSHVFRNLSNVANFYYQQRYNSSDAGDARTLEQELANSNPNPGEMDLLLTQLSLSHRRQTPLIQLSNGEQKKFQLAMALLQRPGVLVLDKVFTGLDTASRKELHQIINDRASAGTTIVLVTDERELPDCTTHIAWLEKGKLTCFSERKEFTPPQPAHHPPLGGQPKATFLPAPATRYERIVKMTDVSIRYGDKTVLFNINWDVRPGERWLISGHNGAGKSTLLSLVTADNPQAYAQQIYLFDKRRGSGESIWDIKKNIGFISPELHRYFDPSTIVHQVIASGLFDTMGLFKRLDAALEKRVDDWIRVFGLAAEKHKPLHLLPAGRQRLALLARALIKHPVLLVLDEPCQGLDTGQAGQFLELIDEVCRQAGTTLIYVSHYDNEIPRSITHTLELHQGQQINLYREQALTA
jgi:molybdate transport system ATP-binding protein